MSCTIAKTVQDLLGRHYDPAVNLQPFIDAAELIVARVVTCAAKKGITLSAEEQATLTKYLAAHFYGSADQYYTARRTGRASGSFMGQSGLGLDGTLYGQNAKLLDPSRCLAGMDSGSGVGFEWLGKPPSEQIPVWERD